MQSLRASEKAAVEKLEAIDNNGFHDREAGRLLELASASDQMISDSSSKGVRSQRDNLLTQAVLTCMDTVKDLLRQYDTGAPKVLEWVTQLAESTTGRLLVGMTRNVRALGDSALNPAGDKGDSGNSGDDGADGDGY